MEEKEVKKKKTIGVIVVIIILLVVIGALGVVIYILLNSPKETQSVNRSAAEGLIVDGNIDKKASEARFTTDMNMIWTFPSGSKVSNNAHIGNSENNEYECYFEVYLDNEEQTLLYESPVIPVGKQLDKLELNQVLPDGNYEAVCTYHLLDDEDPSKELGKISFNVTLMFIEG